MKAWDVFNQVRGRVKDETGVLGGTGSLKAALCCPSPYSVGMSSLGFQTIYREMNLHPGASAERAFLPDQPEEYRKRRLPVFTYEGETPLGEFPVVAFSIAYELELAGLLEILDLSNIPVLRSGRTEKHPLIIAGGPLTLSNPAILAPFVDLVILGEGEDLVHTLLDAVRETGRRELLSCFSRAPGFFVPGLSSSLLSISRVSPDRLPAYSQILTRKAVWANMFLIEPERGCSHACAYCVMRRAPDGGMRLVPAQKVLSLIPEHTPRVGLVGAAVTDHPEVEELAGKIVSGGRRIGISSLRAERLNENLLRILVRGGYRTLTTALDGFSGRLRARLGRKTTEQHLIRAAEMVRSTGMQRLKLYQMIGVPGETMEDIDEGIRFSLELGRIAPLSLSIAPFVAKRNTPLDGAPFEAVDSLERKLAAIRSGLKGKVDVRPSSARWAWVEYMLSQGGEDAGLAAMEAWKNGGGFAAWKKAFNVPTF
ncbi:MAG: radical SAM protein [Acidobacteria bacterium]|nr:radical SAM protein [Acidobacteriota bacterium]